VDPVFRRAVVFAAVAAALVAAYLALSWSGALEAYIESDVLRERIVRLGWLGPAAVIALMTTAIVFSPIPSAPIAMAAGAAYGHLWGAAYVGLGAETGALAAFFIARILGREAMQRWLGDRVSVGWLGSQTVLMAIVFATRLMPFLSFDLISYAAGLTPITWWRFALATVLGIAPASFLLAHFGAAFASADARRVGWAVLALGAATVLPLAVKSMLDWRRRRRDRVVNPPS
jgi:uncharacterized membrane protein YdjX (TVP38/TMEM64 family)